MQLAEFLYSLAMGERRVSYLLRPGRAGEMLVRDVRIAEGVKVKREAGVADGVGGGMVGKEKSVRVRDHKRGLESVGRTADRVRFLRRLALGLRNMMG